MARQLWLLRHGEAEPHGARSDADRELTSRGEDQSRSAGRALVALEIHFQLVLSSPKVRARETARLACAELGCEFVEHAPLAEDFTVDEALALAGAEEDQRVLLVGHNPDLSDVVGDLTGARIDLKKGGVAGVRLHGARGELMTLLRPRELDRIRG